MTLLSPTEAAAELKITLKTLRGHVADGSIAFVITGRGKKRPRYAFAKVDLDAFEEARRRRRLPAEGRKQCRSTAREALNSTVTTSGGEVVAFSALRARQTNGGRKT
jgi:hypothetical protein